eukprot:15061313-Alexandrium_andersonii.AAC.1
MSASLVGSEMCIRDSDPMPFLGILRSPIGTSSAPEVPVAWAWGWAGLSPCLLYTSDAADDM